MKRLHVHVSVKSIEESIEFYSTLFGAPPVKQKPDYAKWLLDDPRVNFAISARGRKPGLDHFGIQVDEDTELAEVRERIGKSDLKVLEEGKTTCCYAQSDKTWIMDPAGLPWEAYKTMRDAEIFNEVKGELTQPSTCCTPQEEKAVTTKKSTCC